jgi:hypothetical protein
MPRPPLPIGTWGQISPWATKTDDKGRTITHLPRHLPPRHQEPHPPPPWVQIRIGEANTPRIDTVISRIKATAGAPTAKTCRVIISGAMKIAVRYGAISVNPVREVDTIRPNQRPPRVPSPARKSPSSANTSPRTNAPSRPTSPTSSPSCSAPAFAYESPWPPSGHKSTWRPHCQDHPHHRPGQRRRPPAQDHQVQGRPAPPPPPRLGNRRPPHPLRGRHPPRRPRLRRHPRRLPRPHQRPPLPPHRPLPRRQHRLSLSGVLSTLRRWFRSTRA